MLTVCIYKNVTNSNCGPSNTMWWFTNDSAVKSQCDVNLRAEGNEKSGVFGGM